MSFKRVALSISCLLLAFGLAASAQASHRFHLVGGGMEIAIGGGLPLPPQNLTPNMTGSIFPNLLVPANTSRIIRCTTSMAIQKNCCLPKSLLDVPPAQRTIGLFSQNPTLYAVATNLGFHWPIATAHISTGARTGNTTTTFFPPVGGSIKYSNAKGRKFGGPARFSVTHGTQPQGRINNSPVTIYAVAARPTGNPPCTHPAFGGTNSACIGFLLGAWPLPTGAIGGPVSVTGMTVPAGNPKPGIGVGKFGSSPLGTVSLFAWTGGNASGATNQATSYGYPWTTGMLTIKMPAAGETFTITGKDNRTTGGSGVIQLVAGSLSTRVVSGPNANRGWIRLVLERMPGEVPAMSPAGLVATAGLMLLAVGYALRRRLPR